MTTTSSSAPGSSGVASPPHALAQLLRSRKALVPYNMHTNPFNLAAFTAALSRREAQLHPFIFACRASRQSAHAAGHTAAQRARTAHQIAHHAYNPASACAELYLP